MVGFVLDGAVIGQGSIDKLEEEIADDALVEQMEIEVHFSFYDLKFNIWLYIGFLV